MVDIKEMVLNQAIERLNDFTPPCRSTHEHEKEIFNWDNELIITYKGGFYTVTLVHSVGKTVRTPYKGRIRTALQSWKAL